ncbi:MAG: PAC2 family protein [Sulfolobaceae archaeon]
MNVFSIDENTYIIEYETPQISKPAYLLVGLPDAGLVGEIATEYIIRKFKLKLFSSVYIPKLLPPISKINNGIANSPIELYYGNNLIVLHSWIAVSLDAIYSIAKIIINYAKKYKIDTILSLTGFPIQNRLDIEKPSLYWITNTLDLAEEMSKFSEIKKFGDGYLAGPYAPILLESIKEGIRNLVIVTESFSDLPDPEASALALSFISKYIGIEIDTSDLLKEAEEIREKIRGLMEQTRRQMPTYALGRPSSYV